MSALAPTESTLLNPSTSPIQQKPANCTDIQYRTSACAVGTLGLIGVALAIAGFTSLSKDNTSLSAKAMGATGFIVGIIVLVALKVMADLRNNGHI